jgi:ABC-2 type transport system permease protein
MGRLAHPVAGSSQFLRDWLLVALMISSTGDLVLCTVALSFDVRNHKLALHDGDRSQLSARLSSGSRRLLRELIPAASLRDVDRLLDAGRATLALVIPPGLAMDVAAGRSAEVRVLLSGTNSNTANAARGAAAIVGGFARRSHKPCRGARHRGCAGQRTDTYLV